MLSNAVRFLRPVSACATWMKFLAIVLGRADYGHMGLEARDCDCPWYYINDTKYQMVLNVVLIR